MGKNSQRKWFNITLNASKSPAHDVNRILPYSVSRAEQGRGMGAPLQWNIRTRF
jgi:hypothetical protein